MKNKIYIILGIQTLLTLICIILTILCLIKVNKINNTYKDSSTVTEENNINETESKEQDIDNYKEVINNFKIITAQDIENESKNNLIVVMLGRENCGYCHMYAPVLYNIASSYNINIRYIDYASIYNLENWEIIDEEAYNIIYNLKGVESTWDGFGITSLEATPATLFIKDNKIVYGISGYIEEEDLKIVFAELGIGE